MTGRTLITGGAGFVGTNLASRLLRRGEEVVVLDDLSRPGVRENLRWLESTFPGEQLDVVVADVRDAPSVRRALAGVTAVFHFAAQVAVTTSVTEPLHDFSVNLLGTITLLEELRRLESPPPMLFTSTNKVYGGLEDVQLGLRGETYAPTTDALRAHGICEDRPLSFCSPYGCSKGGADQYVLDYAKSFGLRTVAFRMSCIYGFHQWGNEDQGWVAHFLMQAMADRPITIYGDGRQVRDVLFVDDVVDAMTVAVDHISRLSGRAFNIGGGPANTVSLLELIQMIGELEGRLPEVDRGPWRIGDQRWYVSDIRRFTDATGWSPKVSVAEGMDRLHGWLRPDVVHLNGYAHAALDWRVPTVVVAHSCVLSWWWAVHGEVAPPPWSEYRRRVEAGLRAADAVVAPTAAMLAELARWYGLSGGRVVPNCRRSDWVRPRPKEDLILGSGRLWDDAKNLALLDRVAPDLPWPVAIAGVPGHPEGGEAWSSAGSTLLGRLGRVEMEQWLLRASVFVLPARYEPFGLGPLEAGLAGCALVLGDIPSLREVWGDAALYVDPDDTPGLVRVVRRLATDLAWRTAWSGRARRRALQFDPARTAAAYDSVYRAVAAAATTTKGVNA